MPIIETDTIIFEGRQFKKQVRINADGVFRVKVPAEIKELLNIEEITGETKGEALINFGEIIQAFNNKEVETRKVIRFKYQANSMLRNRHDMESISFCSGGALSVAVTVMDETKTTTGGGKTTYSYSRDREANTRIGGSITTNSLVSGNRGGQHNELLGWTPELEVFFKDLNDSMEMLITKVHEIMNSNDSLLTFAESNVKLLGDRSSDNTPPIKEK